MKYKAIVSAHIWVNESGREEIEVLTLIHDDDRGTGIFDDIEQALLEDIVIGDSLDYYFIAVVESEYVEHVNWEGSEWDVEHTVTEVKSVQDIAA